MPAANSDSGRVANSVSERCVGKRHNSTDERSFTELHTSSDSATSLCKETCRSPRPQQRVHIDPAVLRHRDQFLFAIAVHVQFAF